MDSVPFGAETGYSESTPSVARAVLDEPTFAASKNLRLLLGIRGSEGDTVSIELTRQ